MELDITSRLSQLKNSLNNNFGDSVTKKTELDSGQKLLNALSDFIEDYCKENLPKLIADEVKKQLAQQQANRVNPVIGGIEHNIKIKEQKLKKNGITV